LLGIAEHTADIAYALGNAVVGDEDARPDSLHDFVTVDEPPGVLHEIMQERKNLGRRARSTPSASNAPRSTFRTNRPKMYAAIASDLI
jgi:hypothetical protein